MVGLLAPTVIALAAALALGGSLRGLVDTRIRGGVAIIGCFALELLLYNPPVNAQPWAMHVGPSIWLATRFILLAVLIANARAASAGPTVWPWWLAALGVALNTLVIAANGGHMPQSPEAAMAIWGTSHIDSARLQNIAALTPDTQFPLLADVYAEPRWLPRPNVISVGDILLALGVACCVFSRTTAHTNGDRSGKGSVKISFRFATPTHGVARSRGRTSS